MITPFAIDATMPPRYMLTTLHVAIISLLLLPIFAAAAYAVTMPLRAAPLRFRRTAP